MLSNEGITMRVHSLIECVQFLLERGLPYVLTEVFCQDYLENYFGKQRAVTCRKDNPNLRNTGYNDNIINSQFIIWPLAGNVRKHQNKWEIDETPVPKKPLTTTTLHFFFTLSQGFSLYVCLPVMLFKYFGMHYFDQSCSFTFLYIYILGVILGLQHIVLREHP